MVSISRKRVKTAARHRARSLPGRDHVVWRSVGGMVLVIGMLAVILFTFFALDRDADTGALKKSVRKLDHPDLHVQDPNSESYNAIALDVIQTLDCASLLNTTADRPRQQLQQEGEEAMDDLFPGADQHNYVVPTAAHLFCTAAVSSDSKVDFWKSQLSCEASAKDLLEIWSSARSEMPEDLLKKVLSESTDHERSVLGKELHVWAPLYDDGIEYMIGVLNAPDDNDIRGLDLGPGKLFVDVGSCLGLTSIAVSILYPETSIVSIEAAAPNWLLQELTWTCNAELKRPKILLGGVGPHASTAMAKFLWRPSSTTSTRSWTLKNERLGTDVELTVKLQSWHSLLAQAEIVNSRIDVLNVDCEGCEYNLVPALSEDEFRSISTVLGGVHWGYIPPHKLPSSSRGKATHERLCQHEVFARTAKECCAFPGLQVTSRIPGEVLVQESKAFPPKPVTVIDLAGALCDDFREWSQKVQLNDIESDFGWFQISSVAD